MTVLGENYSNFICFIWVRLSSSMTRFAVDVFAFVVAAFFSVQLLSDFDSLPRFYAPLLLFSRSRPCGFLAAGRVRVFFLSWCRPGF